MGFSLDFLRLLLRLYKDYGVDLKENDNVFDLFLDGFE